jgi:quinol monooxygenase YgiN
MNQFIVIEIIHALPGKTEELKAALVHLVPFSLSEPGCLHYEISQSTTEPENFLVNMKFQDSHNLVEHNNSKHIQDFVKKYDKKLYDNFSETHWFSCCL